ncbi:MAG: 8-oxo-dGTP diphosphatase [Defluviitaleaceae bacterium]|nr:8-oxo-dGTP diphosphatase [Defluviitaleaceae bacterium]
MFLCTECFIQKDGKTLMLHRNKKENDINKNKWIGLGGKFEIGESPEECLIREVKEEAGVILNKFRLRGIVTFNTIANKSDDLYYIFIYTASEYTGEIGTCDEGDLHWVDNDKILDRELWEGDRLFWDWILNEKGLFSANFIYDGDKLVKDDVIFYF